MLNSEPLVVNIVWDSGQWFESVDTVQEVDFVVSKFCKSKGIKTAQAAAYKISEVVIAPKSPERYSLPDISIYETIFVNEDQ